MIQSNFPSIYEFHKIQGWAPNFIPKIAEDGYERGGADEVVTVEEDEAIMYAKELSTKEGIFTGISGGATFASAMKIAERDGVKGNILVMLPDTMERYLSTDLFKDIEYDMNEEEHKLARTTPNFLMD